MENKTNNEIVEELISKYKSLNKSIDGEGNFIQEKVDKIGNKIIKYLTKKYGITAQDKQFEDIVELLDYALLNQFTR